MPRGGKAKLSNTIAIRAQNVELECKRCGFKSVIAPKADLGQMATMRYAYQKMHGEGLCEPKGNQPE